MERMASIELALKNETMEREFYLNEAKRSKNPLAQAMFAQLAKDEEEHMHRIRGLHEKLIGAGNWPKDVPLQVAGTDIKKVLDTLVAKAGSDKEHDGNDLAALRKALDFESKGEKLYTDLAKICENPMERNFFGFLAKIEREHHLSIADTLSYLEDPAAWMMQHERAGLDGA